MTWKDIITEDLKFYKKTWDDVVAHTLTEDELSSAPNGKPFNLWTDDKVYFTVDFEGKERLLSVPRNPTERTIK